MVARMTRGPEHDTVSGRQIGGAYFSHEKVATQSDDPIHDLDASVLQNELGLRGGS